MDTAQARVIAVRGARATLIFESRPACPRCAAGKGCGAGLMFGALPAQEIEVDVPPGLTLVGGEQLELALPGASVLRAAFFAYGLPLAGALALLALAWAVAGPLPDLAAVAIATGGLALGWCFSRQKLKSGDRHMEFAADIVCKHGTGR